MIAATFRDKLCRSVHHCLPVQFIFSLSYSFITRWGIDPLNWCHVKLFIGQIHRLPEYPDKPGTQRLFYHPIWKVEILGTIVAIEIREKFTKYYIDDSTGVISALSWNGGSATADRIKLLARHFGRQLKIGDTLRVLGQLKIYDGVREVAMENLYIETDPNTELLHWAEVMTLTKEVYSQPDPRMQEAWEASYVAPANALGMKVIEYFSARGIKEVCFADWMQVPCLRQLAEDLVLVQTFRATQAACSTAKYKQDIRHQLKHQKKYTSMMITAPSSSPSLSVSAPELPLPLHLVYKKPSGRQMTRQVVILFSSAVVFLTKNDMVVCIDEERDLYRILPNQTGASLSSPPPSKRDLRSDPMTIE